MSAFRYKKGTKTGINRLTDKYGGSGVLNMKALSIRVIPSVKSKYNVFVLQQVLQKNKNISKVKLTFNIISY